MKIDVLVKRAERALADAEARVKSAREELSRLTEGKDDLADDEAKRAAELVPELRAARLAVTSATRELDDIRKTADEEADFDRRAATVTPSGAAAPAARGTADVHVTGEPRTYSKERDPHGEQFIRDVAMNFMYRDPGAGSRIERHMSEERTERGRKLSGYEERAAGDAPSSAFGAIVVPQYLIDMTAPAVAGMRPFADVCAHHDLPAEGLTLTIPKITTPTRVSDQTSELLAGGEQSIAETDLAVTVRTALGDQTVSRQAIERGRGTDEIVMQDLVKRYVTNLDSQVINLATVGLEAVANAQTAPADMNVPTIYSKIEGAAAGIETLMLGQAIPSHVIMHPRRWHAMAAQFNNTWPLVAARQLGGPTVAANTVGYGGVRGELPNGLLVVADANIATNFDTGTVCDHIYVVPASECHLWEDPGAPAFIRAEQPAAQRLGVLLVLYGYYAFTLQRFGAGLVQKVPGLTVPTF
jgi:hypothetical protein